MMGGVLVDVTTNCLSILSGGSVLRFDTILGPLSWPLSGRVQSQALLLADDVTVLQDCVVYVVALLGERVGGRILVFAQHQS